MYRNKIKRRFVIKLCHTRTRTRATVPTTAAYIPSINAALPFILLC
jgi:hypothetical protein